MVTRVKAATKATIPTANSTTLNEDAMQRHVETEAEAAASALPTGKRMLVAVVASLVGYASSFYWSMIALDWLATVALAYTASNFIAFLIIVVGGVLAFIAAARLGYKIGMFVLGYKPGDMAKIGASLNEARRKRTSLVREWFTPSDRIAV